MKKDNSKRLSSFVISCIISALVICLVVGFLMTLYTLKPNQTALVLQFGKVVDTVSTPGLHFKHVWQSVKPEYTGEQIYDLPVSSVITADKKSMLADCYATWQVEDPLKYYQKLSNSKVAESRIDVIVYNSMKNIISATQQKDVISGKDGSLDKQITEHIDSTISYGISITSVDTKRLDLPDENKDAVYNRMISERDAIAAKYTAEGEQVAIEKKSAADKEARQTISEAETTAADTIAEGEAEYYKILADAYNKDASSKEFYNYLISIDAMKESLVNGGTFVINEDSPLYGIVNPK